MICLYTNFSRLIHFYSKFYRTINPPLPHPPSEGRHLWMAPKPVCDMMKTQSQCSIQSTHNTAETEKQLSLKG